MKSFLCIAMLLVSFHASADRQNGEIIGFIPSESGSKKLFFIQLKDNVVGGCNVTGRFAFDSSKLNYDVMVSAMMAAYFSKTPVQVEYTKTCNVFGNVYDISYVCIGTIPC